MGHQAFAFLLARAAARVGAKFEAEVLAPLGINSDEAALLLALAGKDHVRLGELAAAAGLSDMSTVSRTVGRLVRGRLASRRRASDDARAVRITILERGRGLASKLRNDVASFDLRMRVVAIRGELELLASGKWEEAEAEAAE